VNLRPHRKQSPELDVTPLIDVVFLLLIFFMVSTTFDKETEIKVELPEAAGEDAENAAEMIEITIDERGNFYINQREVVSTEIDILKRAIAKAAGDRTDLPVLINADGKAPHQAVMTAMDAASQLGLVKMTFAARRPR
jgi:biopolymer transport protein ExbD